ncbi:MAG: 4-(cytidine 5'-diphospho)-2-C-methyl-D-erythritol kinase [Hyphomicrobium sp.]|uniref:4-(cytidine 5'-diphospho)-2-C-methyl-D-erythritol kinase n=1 Tax=Hyphomicrobium sp. TaxID=82 RepID=UPI003D0A3625
MTPIHELALAKINLTLEVAGRRADGYHQVASLVAFASAGDGVTFMPGAASEVAVSGPFAGGLSGANILARALALIAERAPQLRLGSVGLDKRLPVAAGIGGGSSDAAALLRAVRRANGALADKVDWHDLAALLGADVPVCLAGRPSLVTGFGEEVHEIDGGLPPLQAVLVNPMVPVPADKTARVFRVLGAGAVAAEYAAPSQPSFADRDALLAFMRAAGNDLACAAETVVPETGAVLAAIGALASCEHAAVSGAGPTCFGIFADATAADLAREAIAEKHPGWWVVAVSLGDDPVPVLTGRGNSASARGRCRSR